MLRCVMGVIMAEKEKSQERYGSIAYWFGTLGTLANVSIVQYVPDEHKEICIASSSVAVTIISVCIVWLLSKFGQPLGFVRYKACLERDRDNIKNALKDENISGEARERLQRKYDVAVEKLATAESDYNSGVVSVAVERIG